MKQIPQCLICYKQYQLVTLNCYDVFCEGCIQECFLNSKVKQYKYFQCPNCKKKIDLKLIKQYIPQDVWDNDLVLKFEFANCAKQNEKFIECQSTNCQAAYYIWKDAEYFTCENCKNSYCLKCQQVNHKPRTCIEELRMNSINRSRIQFLTTVYSNLETQICPHCLMIVEKNGGCNVMTCSSSQCQNQKSFCFKCGVELDKNYAASHYLNNDQFNGDCKVLLNGQWEDKNNIPENEIQCPKCQNTDPFISKIENNFVICKSQICFDKIYCHICGIEMNDANILNHIDDHQAQKHQGLQQ